jgi:LysR family transcriptional regulator of abg operon
MKLHQIQALVAVVDHGSIRAAARALHLSQAALTKSLRLLEDENGVALLVRKSSGVALTEMGQRLLMRARMITRQLALASDEMRQSLGDGRGLVRIGLTPYLTLTVLGEAFKWFRKRYPQVTVHVMEGLMSRVTPVLRDGTLDFAIVASSGEIALDEFATEHLTRHEQVVVVRAGHPVLAKPGAKALALFEWVLPGPLSPPFSVDTYMRDMFAKARVAPPAMVARCEAMAAMSLVRNSELVSIFPVPLLAQPESHGIVAVPMPGLRPAGIELVQLSHADVPMTPAAAYLARCIGEACD